LRRKVPRPLQGHRPARDQFSGEAFYLDVILMRDELWLQIAQA